MKFPVNSLLAGNSAFRDGFARDCLLQRRVCKPSVPLETLTASLQSNLAGPELGFDIWDLPDSNAWSLALRRSVQPRIGRRIRTT